MKNKRYVYCEYDFWIKFFGMEREVIQDREQRRLWDKFDLFLENSVLNFDIRKSEIEDKTIGGTALLDLYQKRGGANINFLSNNFPSLESLSDEDDDFLNSVFLMDISTEECTLISQKTGVFVFNMELVFGAEHVYENNGESFTKNGQTNWNYMMDLKKKSPSISYCNSLIIADRYLLSDVNENAFEYNLKPILNALLPDNLSSDICFNICVIAENICSNIYDKLSKIRNIISDIRKNLNFTLNIYHSRRLHDRSILTNNILLTSGAGFDVIGSDEQPIKFTTTMLIFPFLQNNEKDNVYYVDWIKNILQEEGKCTKRNRNFWGDSNKRHHLLDFYYEEPQMPHSTFAIGCDVDLRERLLASIR